MLRACSVLPLLLLCLAPPSWADQDQHQDQDGTAVKGYWPWPLKRADPEEDATFFAVRGKKSDDDFALKPNSLFSVLATKRFGVLAKRIMKPNSLFGSIKGKRSMKPNSLFGAIPGKRSLKPNSLFSAIPGKRSMKPNSLFGALHRKRMRIGKRSMKPNGLFGVRVRKAIKPNGLFSIAKRNSPLWYLSPSSLDFFLSMGAGKWGPPLGLYSDMTNENDYEQDDLEYVTDEPEDLDEVAPVLLKKFGLSKDKKEAASEFWATRGKRDFWASRGKRGGDDFQPEVDDLNQATLN